MAYWSQNAFGMHNVAGNIHIINPNAFCVCENILFRARRDARQTNFCLCEKADVAQDDAFMVEFYTQIFKAFSSQRPKWNFEKGNPAMGI